MIRALLPPDAEAAAALTPGWPAPVYSGIARGDFPDRLQQVAAPFPLFSDYGCVDLLDL